ncbi:MAG: preprotein translocase subunit SecG [Sphingobacteriales bacterium]|jgi:preprotein translocase subunit SecG
MYVFLTIVTVIICILLILIVLVQNPKGGGLSSTFGGGGGQVMGVQRTNDFLEKSTWTLAIALVVLSLSLTFFMPSKAGGQSIQESEIQDQIDNQGGVPPSLENTPSPIPLEEEPAE